MSQTASLYPVTIKEFEILRININPNDIPEIRERIVLFEQNFEGLRFILSQIVTSSKQIIIEEIFYPSHYLGREIDWENIEYEDINCLTLPIYYITLEDVQKINDILVSIDDADFIKYYNPEQLNQNHIYPSVWHNDESEDQIFNKTHISKGFKNLKELFNKASEENCCVLSFVG